MTAGVEQTNQLGPRCQPINAGEIRPFVSIAAKTGIGEVRQRIGASMLNWYDVFNFERPGVH